VDASRFRFLIVCKTRRLGVARSVGSAEHVEMRVSPTSGLLSVCVRLVHQATAYAQACAPLSLLWDWLCGWRPDCVVVSVNPPGGMSYLLALGFVAEHKLWLAPVPARRRGSNPWVDPWKGRVSGAVSTMRASIQRKGAGHRCADLWQGKKARPPEAKLPEYSFPVQARSTLEGLKRRGFLSAWVAVCSKFAVDVECQGMVRGAARSTDVGTGYLRYRKVDVAVSSVASKFADIGDAAVVSLSEATLGARQNGACPWLQRSQKSKRLQLIGGRRWAMDGKRSPGEDASGQKVKNGAI